MKNPKKEPEQHPVFKNLALKHTVVQKKLDKLVQYWIPALGLKDWRLIIDYTANSHESNPDINACINAMWEYKSARLRFFLPALVEHDDDLLEVTVVHELSHCLVCPMRTKKSRVKDEEAVVTQLTKAFIRTKYDPYESNPGKLTKNVSK